MTCCLHASLVLQKASNYQCFGCEEEAIHIRHTNLYSAVRDITVVNRTHDDWLGVLNCSVTAEELERSIPEVDLNDCDNDHDGDATGPTLPHGHGTRYQKGRRQVDTAEAAYKAEKIAILKSRFNESLNVLEAATSHEEVDNFFGIIDNGCFAIKRQLPALPARTVTTIARRPAGDAPRKVGARGLTARKRAQKQQKNEAPLKMRQRARAALSGASTEQAIQIESSSVSGADDASAYDAADSSSELDLHEISKWRNNFLDSSSQSSTDDEESDDDF